MSANWLLPMTLGCSWPNCEFFAVLPRSGRATRPAAFIRTIFDVFPITLPFFPPDERALAREAYLARQLRFFAHLGHVIGPAAVATLRAGALTLAPGPRVEPWDRRVIRA